MGQSASVVPSERGCWVAVAVFPRPSRLRLGLTQSPENLIDPH